MMRRWRYKIGVEILEFKSHPQYHFECVTIRLRTGRFRPDWLIAPTFESGLPIKPPCLYGME